VQGNPIRLIDPFGLNAQDYARKAVHTVFDIGGMIFDPLDLINCVMYAAKGDKANAIISGVSGALPFVGDALFKGGSKAVVKAAGDSGSDKVIKMIMKEDADDFAEAAVKGAGNNAPRKMNLQFFSEAGTRSIPKPNTGKGFSTNGYSPKPGERTFEKYVNNNVPKDVETKLYTNSSGFNTNPKNDGHFKRYGTKPNQHVIEGAHVHQPPRTVNPTNGIITGKPGTKTKNGNITEPRSKDIKQLYDYLNNGKYH